MSPQVQQYEIARRSYQLVPRLLCCITIANTLFIQAGVGAESQAAEQGANHPWYYFAGRAGYLRGQSQYEQSWKDYTKALKILKDTKASDTTIIDVELNAVATLIAAGRLSEAQAILDSAESHIAQDKKNSLLEVRYWRRRLSLAHEQKRYKDSANAARHSCQIIKTLFGAHCPDYAEEVHSLLVELIHERNWLEAIETAKIIRSLLNDKLSPDLLTLYNSWIRELDESLTANLTIDSRSSSIEKLRDTIATLHQYVLLPHATAVYWQLYCTTIRNLNLLDPSHSEKTVDGLIEAVNRAGKTKVPLVPLAQAISAIFFDRIFKEKKLDERTVRIGKIAVDLMERAWSKVDRAREIGYLQVDTLYALALVRTNKIAEANEVLEALFLQPRSFQRAEALNGLFQARAEGLAKYYAAEGDAEAVREQFRKLSLAISTITSKTDQEYLKNAWANEEKRLIKIALENRERKLSGSHRR